MSSQMEANIHNIQPSPTNKSGENVATILRRKIPFNFTACELAEQPHTFLPPLTLHDLFSSSSIQDKFYIQLSDTRNGEKTKLSFLPSQTTNTIEQQVICLFLACCATETVPVLCSPQIKCRHSTLKAMCFMLLLPYLAECIAYCRPSLSVT